MAISPAGWIEPLTSEPTPPRRATSPSLALAWLSFGVRVASDAPGVLRTLRAAYPTARWSRRGNQPLSTLRVAGARDDPGDPTWAIVQDGQERGRVASPVAAAVYLDQLIQATAVSTLGSWLAIHTGVVVRDGQALLLPAASQQGKSTLVAALALTGWSYLSDELALFSTAGGDGCPEWHAFPRAIRLRSGGWRHLRDLRPAGTGASQPVGWGEETYHYLRLAPASPAASGRIRWVVLPERVAGQPPRLQPLTRAHALAELVRHSLNLPRHGASGLDTLARVVEGADCYRLTYGQAAEAVALLDPLAAKPRRAS
jgi:hypothetical protein